MNSASAVPMALAAPACEWAVAEGVVASPHFAAALARRWLAAESGSAAADCARRGAGRRRTRDGTGRAVRASLCPRVRPAGAAALASCVTAGERLRVVLLVAAGGVEPPALAAFATRAPAAGSIDACVAVVGGAELPVEWTASDVLREARIIPLPVAPDNGDAKRIAALDPDVIVDLAGLEVATGPLLALASGRRTILTVAGLAHSQCRASGRFAPTSRRRRSTATLDGCRRATASGGRSSRRQRR